MKLQFYKSWLPLPKPQFRIMAMLADKGKFSGTLGDLCDYYLITRQQKNRDSLKDAIYTLEKQNFLTFQRQRNTWIIEAVPKAEEITIEIDREWYQRIRLRSPQGRSVSWEVVLKVLLWACDNDYDDIITNQDISNDLNTSPQSICSAKAVLDNEFGAIIKSRVSEKTHKGEFRNLGQHLTANAFWK